MSYQMKIDEVLEALLNSNHPAADAFQGVLEQTANAMAICLAASQGVVAGVGTFEGVGFAGLCVPFFPALEGQPLPECMDGYDESEEWEFDPDFEPAAGTGFRPEGAGA